MFVMVGRCLVLHVQHGEESSRHLWCRDLNRGISVLPQTWPFGETSMHNSAVSLGYIFGALYIAGLPIQVVAQLYWYRNNLQDRSVKVRYMFLFHNYREGLYWYECVNMLRKIGLVTALVLLQEDLGTQVFALSILSMTYLTLHAYIKPYSSRTLNWRRATLTPLLRARAASSTRIKPAQSLSWRTA